VVPAGRTTSAASGAQQGLVNSHIALTRRFTRSGRLGVNVSHRSPTISRCPKLTVRVVVGTLKGGFGRLSTAGVVTRPDWRRLLHWSSMLNTPPIGDLTRGLFADLNDLSERLGPLVSLIEETAKTFRTKVELARRALRVPRSIPLTPPVVNIRRSLAAREIERDRPWPVCDLLDAYQHLLAIDRPAALAALESRSKHTWDCRDKHDLAHVRFLEALQLAASGDLPGALKLAKAMSSGPELLFLPAILRQMVNFVAESILSRAADDSRAVLETALPAGITYEQLVTIPFALYRRRRSGVVEYALEKWGHRIHAPEVSLIDYAMAGIEPMDDSYWDQLRSGRAKAFCQSVPSDEDLESLPHASEDHAERRDQLQDTVSRHRNDLFDRTSDCRNILASRPPLGRMEDWTRETLKQVLMILYSHRLLPWLTRRSLEKSTSERLDIEEFETMAATVRATHEIGCSDEKSLARLEIVLWNWLCHTPILTSGQCQRGSELRREVLKLEKTQSQLRSVGFGHRSAPAVVRRMVRDVVVEITNRHSAYHGAQLHRELETRGFQKQEVEALLAEDRQTDAQHGGLIGLCIGGWRDADEASVGPPVGRNAPVARSSAGGRKKLADSRDPADANKLAAYIYIDNQRKDGEGVKCLLKRLEGDHALDKFMSGAGAGKLSVRFVETAIEYSRRQKRSDHET